MLPSVYIITPACTHITILPTKLYTMKKLTVHHIHHMVKCLSCHKAIFGDNQAMISCVIHMLLLQNLSTLCGMDSFLHMVFTFFVIVFWSKPKFNSFKKMSKLFIFNTSKNVKIHKAKFEAGYSCEECNQFLL